MTLCRVEPNDDNMTLDLSWITTTDQFTSWSHKKQSSIDSMQASTVCVWWWFLSWTRTTDYWCEFSAVRRSCGPRVQCRTVATVYLNLHSIVMWVTITGAPVHSKINTPTVRSFVCQSVSRCTFFCTTRRLITKFLINTHLFRLWTDVNLLSKRAPTRFEQTQYNNTKQLEHFQNKHLSHVWQLR